jgi:DNA-binding response OmpR family regulator
MRSRFEPELSVGSVKRTWLPRLSHQLAIALPFPKADNSDVVRETSPVILVVEDDSAVRQPLVKFLQMRQYTVVTAETADEGLDAIKMHRPAAAIVDLRLRRGSGREVVVSIPPDVPVIIFSGLRSESADLETIRPLTRLVEKPYSLVMLMDTLEDMLEQAKGNQSGFGRLAAN